MDSLDIFVSSKTKELLNERKGIKKQLESISNRIHVFIFESDAAASKSTAQEVFREEVIKSQVYVGIFKNEYSAATEEEYQLAVDSNKDILIYINDVEKENRDAQLEKLLKTFKKKHVVRMFVTAKELEDKIKEDTLSLLIEKYKISDTKIDLGEITYYPPSYFQTHKVGNLGQWRRGFSFNLVSIKNEDELRREKIINEIVDKSEKTNVVVVTGMAGYSKTTLLYEIACHFHDNNHLTFMVDGSVGISNTNKIIENIEMLLATGKKILVAIDNAHAYGALAIFSVIDSLESHIKFNNVKFVLTARTNEIEKLMSYRYVGIGAQLMESIVKILGDSSRIYVVPPFDKLDIKKFILKYGQLPKPGNEQELDKFACDIFDKTSGHPVMVKFLLLGTGLDEHIKSIKNEYLSTDTQLKSMTILSLLSISEIQITDLLLDKMELRTSASALENATLVRDDGIWRTIHILWDERFLLLLFSKPKSFLKNKKYLVESLQKIFSISDENIVFSVLKKIYRLAAEDVLTFDFVEKIVIPQYVSKSIRANLYATLADAYEDNSNYNKALEKYNEAINIDPDNHQILNQKGYCLHKLGMEEEAAKLYERAIQVSPDMPYAYINLAVSLGRLGRFEEGINAATIGLNKASKSNDRRIMSVLLLNRGFVEMGQGRLQEAEHDFNQSIDFNDDSAAYSNLGRLYFLRQNFKKAIEYCDKALSLDSRDEIAMEYKINSLKVQGLDKEAEEVFNVLKKLNLSFYEDLKDFYSRPNWRVRITEMFWSKNYA